MKQYNYTLKDDELIINVDGTIDSTNAKDVEESIFAIIENNSFKSITLDIQKLEYISSAGLRIILRIMKKYKLDIINASNDVYEIFDMTGFTKMVHILKAYKELDITNCQVIGEGAKGIVYRYNRDTIVKVYKRNDVLPFIQRERELAQKAFVLGIPTAISYDVVRVGDSFGTVYELLDCDCLSECIRKNPKKIDEYTKEFAKLLKQFHTTKLNDKLDMRNFKGKVKTWLSKTEELYDPAIYQRLNKMVDEIEDKDTLIHGDYHTNNLMVQNDEILIIDMDTLSYGNPIFELAIICFVYKVMNRYVSENSMNFLGLDNDTCLRIYDVFIKSYFENTDIKDLDNYLNKIELFSLLRVVYYNNKHINDADITKQAMADIAKLLEIVK